MYRIVAVGDVPNTCESKASRIGAPDYPFEQRSVWTEDAQRYANKLLAKEGRPPLEVTGILDARSCETFSSLCDAQWKLMGPTTLRPDFLVDRETCDQIPCQLATCSHVDAAAGKIALGLLLLGGLVGAMAYFGRSKR